MNALITKFKFLKPESRLGSLMFLHLPALWSLFSLCGMASSFHVQSVQYSIYWNSTSETPAVSVF